jgi:hypothetical protein
MMLLMDGEQLGADRADTVVCFSVQSASQVKGIVE